MSNTLYCLTNKEGPQNADIQSVLTTQIIQLNNTELIENIITKAKDKQIHALMPVTIQIAQSFCSNETTNINERKNMIHELYKNEYFQIPNEWEKESQINAKINIFIKNIIMLLNEAYHTNARYALWLCDEIIALAYTINNNDNEKYLYEYKPSRVLIHQEHAYGLYVYTKLPTPKSIKHIKF